MATYEHLDEVSHLPTSLHFFLLTEIVNATLRQGVSPVTVTSEQQAFFPFVGTRQTSVAGCTLVMDYVQYFSGYHISLQEVNTVC